MKKAKRILAIFMTLAMVLTMTIAMGATVFADETSEHVITIENTDQNVSHTYEGYQIFKGKLDVNQQKLSDIVWGDGVDGAALLAALKASTDPDLMSDDDPPVNLFTDCASAADVAKVFATFEDTSDAAASSGAIDAVAKIIGETDGVLKSTGKISFTEGSGDAAGTYTATVIGDGYYFIKDATQAASLEGDEGSDTLSKYLLAVVKDTTIVAKDTGLTPDKEIVSGNERVKAGTAAIGDTVTFEVKIKVPDTRKYVDHFVFDMVDQLPEGLTFTGITSVKVGTADVPYYMYLDETQYGNSEDTEAPAFVAPEDPVDENAPDEGQLLKLVFMNFKANAEAADPIWIGQDMVITYTAVVNRNADFTPTGNVNEVKFDFSNDPNHVYDGDEPSPEEPMGETPEDETKTLLTNIEITKTGDNGTIAALEGAEFEITSEDYNITLISGEKFDVDEEGTYYKLKDGSYTETEPTDSTASSYDSTETKYKKTEFTDTVTTPGTTKKVTVITGSDGKISLKGLKAGTYRIQETRAPSGYNLDSTVYTIVLELDGTAKVIALNSDESTDGVEFNDNTATAELSIDNKSGAVLPGTGGIGTVIFYVLGSLLVVGCGIVLISKKRITDK